MIAEVLDGLAKNGDEGNGAVEAKVKAQAIDAVQALPDLHLIVSYRTSSEARLGYPGAPRCFCMTAAERLSSRLHRAFRRLPCTPARSKRRTSMRCPYCAGENTQVKDSRPTEENAAIRRRRICPDCGGRFTTFERVQLRELTRRQALGPQGAVRSRQADAFGRGRAAQAAHRAASASSAWCRASCASSKAPARARSRPRRSAASSWRRCAGSTPSPTCALPPSIAISARRRISTRCCGEIAAEPARPRMSGARSPSRAPIVRDGAARRSIERRCALRSAPASTPR